MSISPSPKNLAKWVLLAEVRRSCSNPACDGFGGVPCDCVTKAGKPRRACQISGWIRSHPCPVCCAPEGES